MSQASASSIGNRKSEIGNPSPPWRRPRSRILVVLPAYNEEANLGTLLERIDQAMFENGDGYQVIVVDDGSRDATARVAEEHACHMPIAVLRHEKNQGLGATIRDGLLAAADICADDDIVVAMDADNTHTPGLIHSILQRVREGCDVVIASRYRPGSYVRGVPFHRRVLSRAASLLMRALFPTHGVRDYTCGYRGYRGRVLKDAVAKMGKGLVTEDGFQCMVDILLKLRTMGVIFGEVPLILRYDLKGGASKLRVGSTIVRTLRLALRRRLGR
ncbi:MAG: glycosyltransferase family 2 protein [Planctomycetes bacterium]|nr:glycosyltransferase family 2 protein [Planctomycetota bacterium]